MKFKSFSCPHHELLGRDFLLLSTFWFTVWPWRNMLLLIYFDQTNLSFLQSFRISANQLANLWVGGTEGECPSSKFWGHGHLCWKPAESSCSCKSWTANSRARVQPCAPCSAPLSAVCAFISSCPLLQKQGQNQYNNLRATSRTKHGFLLPSLLIHFIPLLKWHLVCFFFFQLNYQRFFL